MEALEAEGLVGMHTLQVPVHQVKDTQDSTGHWTSTGDHRISGGGRSF